jgi:hypothetical protein
VTTTDVVGIPEHDVDEGEDAAWNGEAARSDGDEVRTTNGLATGSPGDGDSSDQRMPTASDRGARRSRRSGLRSGRRGSALRRPVERALALTRLDGTTIGVLAAALDVDADPGNDESLADLAVASLEDAALARSTLRTLTELMTVDDLEAGVIATGMVTERTAFKRLWAVLGTVDPSLPSGVPSRAVHAGLAVARSTRELPDAKRQALLSAHEVLG